MFDQLTEVINRLRLLRPLILNITNAVTMDVVANGLLSLGASPIMSLAPQEIEELVAFSSAVVVNFGTLTDPFIELAMETCRLAHALNKPIIFDPVGAGASHYRTSACQRLLSQVAVAIIRGNASEIMALSGGVSQTKGVDSSMATQDVVMQAQHVAIHHDAVVAMSGAVDVIVDSNEQAHVNRGSALMPFMTGSGCLLSAVVAAFHAVHANRFEAAQLASLFYAVSGEKAAQRAMGPGSFRAHFLDALHETPARGDYESK